MTKAVFTGAHFGPGGMSPGSRKLTVVVNWKVPEEGVQRRGFQETARRGRIGEDAAARRNEEINPRQHARD